MFQFSPDTWKGQLSIVQYHRLAMCWLPLTTTITTTVEVPALDIAERQALP